jgi:hypothetical protein
VVYPDGAVSADALVDQMLAGVDDYDFDMESKAELIKNGVPKEVMQNHCSRRGLRIGRLRGRGSGRSLGAGVSR